MPPDPVTNALGMTMRRIEPGNFRMGADPSTGDAWRIGRDERPIRVVTITEAFAVAETPVTNAQYEAFDETHVAKRGTRGLATGDEEAAVALSWHEAVAFCDWLTAETGDPYRLPTEAEWEYACRAGTTTPFHTGDRLPDASQRHQRDDWHPTPVDLTVGETPPNDWGLRDCHGLVEEWCRDWHGPYPDTPQTDPVGRADGIARVTRGGSHNTALTHLRSASRSGALPADRHWLIGFRPVMAAPPQNDPLPVSASAEWQVERDSPADPPADTVDGPRFEEPVRYVPTGDEAGIGPPFEHDHCPAVTWCANGDLLAVWFSCPDEAAREMTILGSRYRASADEWDDPSVFFDVPDRNLTGSALFHDPASGTIYHFNGVGAASHWANLAVVMRTSADGGYTWSSPRFVAPGHGYRNQVIDSPIRTEDGDLLLPCDAVSTESGGTAIHRSPDDGDTWTDPGRGDPPPRFEDGATGSTIAGIHASVVQLEDGRLLAFGRGDSIDGRMARSVSADGGDTWTYAPSPFPPIGTGQRLALTRLRDGPLLLASFTDREPADGSGMELRTPGGARRMGYGLFVALSFDEGDTWPVRRLVSPGGDPREFDGGGWTGVFETDDTHAEPKGYLTVTQTPDGVVHLLSSALHYRFTREWLTEHADRSGSAAG